MIDIVQADVLRWAKGYDGPKFHAALMDPPYGLEFMGKAWDAPWKTGMAKLGIPGHDLPLPVHGSKRNPVCLTCHKHKRGSDGCRCGSPRFDETPQDHAKLFYDFCYQWATAIYPHLLPGAFCMAFSGARTYHRMACAIEDAGFVLHSMIGWVYGSGFPKATRIDTQVDRAAGAEREVIGPNIRFGDKRAYPENRSLDTYGGGIAEQQTMGMVTAPATDLAATWSGHRYGLQALKPALEPICVFQKPYAGRPVDSITEYGAGALWIDGARIGTNGDTSNARADKSGGCEFFMHGDKRGATEWNGTAGRWPSNLILQHTPECRRVGVKRVRGTHPSNDKRAKSAVTVYSGPLAPGDDPRASELYEQVDEWQCADGCPVKALGEQSGERRAYCANAETAKAAESHAVSGSGDRTVFGYYADKSSRPLYSDTGTAARFFQQCDYALEQAEPFYYCAKASRAERDRGLEGMPTHHIGTYAQDEWSRQHMGNTPDAERKPVHCSHPTVKPIALARYLATLLLPPVEYAPRRILIPFAGVASECIGAHLAGWEDVLGIEAEAEYVELARARVAYWCAEHLPLFAISEAAS
ncbi:MAG: hypothetical protein WC565_04640 [Parcubacteria group bacterium]